MRRLTLLLPLLTVPGFALAQLRSGASADSANAQVALREVVITATRTEKTLAEVPMPITLVSRQQLQAMGAVRLTEALGEQTGLTLTTDHGTGIQLQGLSTEYTLILVDGEPLIGRTAGTLDLSRVAVGNIERVEIVKGPASALWGSEALAGVVNIITRRTAPGERRTSGEVGARYGTNRTIDLNGTLRVKRERLGFDGFVNRYSTAGYALQPESGSSTVPPFQNYTAQSRLTLQLSGRTRLSISGRYFTEGYATSYATTSEAGTSVSIRDEGRAHDLNLNPVLTHHVSDRLDLTGRVYYSQYRTRSDYTYATDGQPYDADFFRQTFTRPEVQAEWRPGASHTITGGVGGVVETVAASRYERQQQLVAPYAYGQHDWTLRPGLSLILGARYDAHSQYAGQLSPKVAARWQARPWLALRASAGRGYRAPDFRQLYLNFSNPVVGYSVFGSREVRARLSELGAHGQLVSDPATGELVINQALLDQAARLTAESSWAANVGFQLDPYERVTLTVNAFRNDLRDLIDTAPVARKANGQSVFTYYNVHSAYTQGVEADVRYQPLNGLTLSAGYQFLDARDKAVLDQLDAGQVFRRDPVTLRTERVKRSDYGGLFNRSRHSANAKVFYDLRGTSLSLRALYRGRYGFADRNGNNILDEAAEYVPGYVVWNVAVARTIRQRYTTQVGCDNLFGYTNPQYVSTLPGRLLFLRLSVALGAL